MTCRGIAPAALLLCCLAPGEALAHASERGHVLLLPTGHYLAGGAAAVAASFLVVAFVPAGWLRRAASARFALGSVGDGLRVITSLAALACLVLLVLAGHFGSRDPLSNPLPLTLWTLLWVGLTLLQGLLGNLWFWLDPWYAPWRLARAVGFAGDRTPPPRSGAWIALALLAGFAWFELIHPAPDDPALLARVVGAYWLVTLAAVLAFGHRYWSRAGEFLSLLWRLVSRLAVLGGERGTDGRLHITLSLPGARLRGAEPLPLSATFFLLFALASVSFDGLSKTFAWLGLIGVNPLEFLGRTAVTGVNTAGLLATFAVLASAFLAAVWLGGRLVGERGRVRRDAGLLIWSIVPIALAYHFSHYLTALAVDGQYALAAISDPFSRGWDLFGTADLQVSAGLVMGHEAAWLLWNLQAFAIVGGHVLAVLLAHGLAHRLHGRRASMSQLPLTVLMILYTVFGLWLLSTPTAG